MLAPILGVSFEQLNHGCDYPFDEQEAAAALKPVIVRAFGRERIFEYRMTVKSGIDLNRPAVYQHWADMFSPWPSSLVRHFGRIQHDLYGWVPRLSYRSSVDAAGTLVKLEAHRPKLDPVGIVDPRTWFAYLPQGRLKVGKALRENRWLILTALAGTARPERYPLSRVDLVGRVTGGVLLEIVC